MAAGRTLIHLWAGDQAHPSTLLIVGFGLWMMISPAGNAIAMFLNGAHIVRFQVVTATIMALTNLALSIVLAHVIGVAGVIWGTVICYTICSLIPGLLYARRLLDRLHHWPYAQDYLAPGYSGCIT
jgi:O-antigen/teichoic acid export membrane protein